MSNSILHQLKELFPTVSEEFINGIYNARKDEEVTVEELIEVILSFEFLPQKEDVNNCSLDISSVSPNRSTISDESGNIEWEVLSFTNNSNIDKPVEDEVLQQSVPTVHGNLCPKGEASSSGSSTDVKQPAVIENVSSVVLNNQNIVSCENNKTSRITLRDSYQVEQNGISESGVLEASVVKIQCNGTNIRVNDKNNSTSSSPSHPEQFNEDENDSSPECSIKYLMREDIVLERHNITTHIQELGEVQERQNEYSTDNGKCDNNCTSLSAGSASSSLLSSNGRSSDFKSKKAIRSRKKSNSSNGLQNGSCQGLSQLPIKRTTLRSCKVKNEEDRLRRRLISQSRHFHERQEKNLSSLCSSQFLELDKKYTLLSNIFTDANPTYLFDQCELLTDQEKILEFISQNLELRDYPKKESLKKESKLMEEFHCTIPNFLEVIPDPVLEFSSSNYIRAGYEENAEIYLKARYEGLSSDEVQKLLQAHRYNLTAVCTQIEDDGRTPTPGVLDYTPLHHPATVFFHQEVWYIEHRKEIQNYLDSTLEAFRMQEEMNRPPPPPEEVFECAICTDEVVEYINLGTCCGPTGHLFCLNCIKRSAEIRIGEGETTFPCLVNCGSFIPLQTVKELLPKNVYDKLMGRIQEQEIRKANIAGVETCPFCPYAYGPGDERVFTCLNPDCLKLSCRICRKEDHSPELCEMFKNEDEERARHIIEDRMAEALMRTCYSCGKNFVKSGGCNKMVCNCGAKMCYVCRQPVVDYSHFNGPGGDNTNRCPLFSQDDELHVRPVEAVAQQVFDEITANNPQLNLDRAKLIPK